MNFYVILLLATYTLLPVESGFTNVYGKIPTYNEDDPNDPGVPLYLTPFIEQGKIKEAQEAARTNFTGFKHITSYSGYLTVNKQFNSNLFVWFFPAAKKC